MQSAQPTLALINMEQKDLSSKGKSTKTKEALGLNIKSEQTVSISHKLIFIFLSISALFLESIFILISSVRKGFIKKETLSRRTNLGFDIIIKRSIKKK